MENYNLRALISEFVKNLKEKGRSQFTIIAYAKDLEQFAGFLASLEKNDVREIKKEDIEGFVNKLIKEGYIKKSASRKLNSVRTFFRFLKNNQAIDQNPSLDVSHPKYIQAPPRILSKLEYHALRDYSKDDPRAYAMIELFLQTGVKIGELANLRLSDIKEGCLFIRAYGKTPPREIPLNRGAKKAIDGYLEVRGNTASDFLFITRTGKPILIRNIRQVINRCFREVEVGGATVNDLRNTFIVQQLNKGLPIEQIAKTVGHRRLSSTERFLNLVKRL